VGNKNYGELLTQQEQKETWLGQRNKIKFRCGTKVKCCEQKYRDREIKDDCQENKAGAQEQIKCKHDTRI
jgi:hypothetical protein